MNETDFRFRIRGWMYFAAASAILVAAALVCGWFGEFLYYWTR